MAAANPTQFRADFPEDVWVLRFSTIWPQGSADYVVKLRVIEATTPPTTVTPAVPTRRLTFTG